MASITRLREEWRKFDARHFMTTFVSYTFNIILVTIGSMSVYWHFSCVIFRSNKYPILRIFPVTHKSLRLIHTWEYLVHEQDLRQSVALLERCNCTIETHKCNRVTMFGISEQTNCYNIQYQKIRAHHISVFLTFNCFSQLSKFKCLWYSKYRSKLCLQVAS